MRVSLAVALLTLLFAVEPSQAGFLQTDPLGYAAGMDLYTYVQNDPANNTDPTGEATVYEFPDGSRLIVQTFENRSQFTDTQSSPKAVSCRE